MIVLKEWPIALWVVLKDGLPFDYAFSRAMAFKIEKRRKGLEPDNFWSVAPHTGIISIKVERC